MDISAIDWGQVVTGSVEYGVKAIKFILIVWVGFWLANWVGKLGSRLMEKNRVDIALRKFIHNLSVVFLKTIVVIAALATAGIATASFVAVLGAIGLAIGLALQGSLSNFAGGILILLFRPFRVGDFITTQDYSGTVDDIGILYTVMTTPEKNTIILPNGLVANNSITNFSKLGYRRIDVGVGIAYDADIDQAKKTIREVIQAEPNALCDQEITVSVLALGDSSVDLAVRCFVENELYWKTYFRLHENVKKALDKAGIQIPFPQRDVHIYRQD